MLEGSDLHLCLTFTYAYTFGNFLLDSFEPRSEFYEQDFSFTIKLEQGVAEKLLHLFAPLEFCFIARILMFTAALESSFVRPV